MNTLKVVLVDDHRIIRDGIRSYLDDDEKYTVIGEANSGEEALTLLETLTPHLVIMDISMGGIDGIECTRQINQQWPEVKVVALTMLNEPQYIRQMMDAGASAYLLKNSDDHEVKAALEAAMRGETYYSPEVTSIVMNSLLGKAAVTLDDTSKHRCNQAWIDFAQLIPVVLIQKEFFKYRFSQLIFHH